MKSSSHERTPAFMTVDIKRSRKCVYNIKVRCSEREEARWEPSRQISHVEMCRFNGVKLFGGGTLKGSFGCICDEETDHCMGGSLMCFEIEEERDGQLVPVESHDALLICRGGETSGTKTDASANWPRTVAEQGTEQDETNSIDAEREVLRGILKKQIPRTHRPGGIGLAALLYFC